jgi:hypothetical protein
MCEVYKSRMLILLVGNKRAVPKPQPYAGHLQPSHLRVVFDFRGCMHIGCATGVYETKWISDGMACDKIKVRVLLYSWSLWGINIPGQMHSC